MIGMFKYKENGLVSFDIGWNSGDPEHLINARVKLATLSKSINERLENKDPIYFYKTWYGKYKPTENYSQIGKTLPRGLYFCEFYTSRFFGFVTRDLYGEALDEIYDMIMILKNEGRSKITLNLTPFQARAYKYFVNKEREIESEEYKKRIEEGKE